MQTTYNQSLLDAALLETGTLESLFAIAAAAGLSIMDLPTVGQTITAPAGAPVYKKDLKYLKDNGIVRGTVDDPNAASGIGFWRIEVDFIVS